MALFAGACAHAPPRSAPPEVVVPPAQLPDCPKFEAQSAAPLGSDQPSVEAGLSNEPIPALANAPATAGGCPEVTYVLTAHNAPNGKLVLPSFGELSADGPSHRQESSVAMAPGAAVLRTSAFYLWRLRAPRAGQFTVGVATLTFNGHRWQSKPVVVTCGGTAPPPPVQ